MEPIISPWVFYLINLLHKICGISLITCIVSILLLLLLYNDYKNNKTSNYIEADVLGINIIAFYKNLIKVCIISGILFLLIPPKSVMLEMLISYFITPDNINYVSNDVIEFITKISSEITNAASK